MGRSCVVLVLVVVCARADKVEFSPYPTHDVTSCSPHEYKCYDGSCVNVGLVCNGVANCAENEDETGCVTGTKILRFVPELCEGTPCRKRPATNLTTITPGWPQTNRQLKPVECVTPSSLQPCGNNATVFYYDESTTSCKVADFGGCGYFNSFRSQEECERRCGAFGAALKGLDINIPANCVDNPLFANCSIIAQTDFCNFKYYKKFCCKTCVEAGQLDPRDVQDEA